jgi:hypothetical protein
MMFFILASVLLLLKFLMEKYPSRILAKVYKKLDFFLFWNYTIRFHLETY